MNGVDGVDAVDFIHLIFFPEAFYASVKTIPLLYGAPSYKGGLHSIFDLRLAHMAAKLIECA